MFVKNVCGARAWKKHVLDVIFFFRVCDPLGVASCFSVFFIHGCFWGQVQHRLAAAVPSEGLRYQPAARRQGPCQDGGDRASFPAGCRRTLVLVQLGVLSPFQQAAGLRLVSW